MWVDVTAAMQMLGVVSYEAFRKQILYDTKVLLLPSSYLLSFSTFFSGVVLHSRALWCTALIGEA
jgi:hypothetical protein